MSSSTRDLRREVREKIPTCDDCGTALVPGREGCHDCS